MAILSGRSTPPTHPAPAPREVLSPLWDCGLYLREAQLFWKRTIALLSRFHEHYLQPVLITSNLHSLSCEFSPTIWLDKITLFLSHRNHWDLEQDKTSFEYGERGCVRFSSPVTEHLTGLSRLVFSEAKTHHGVEGSTHHGRERTERKLLSAHFLLFSGSIPAPANGLPCPQSELISLNHLCKCTHRHAQVQNNNNKREMLENSDTL